MHVEKYKAADVYNTLNHDLRISKNHTNEKINPELKHLNYNLRGGDPKQIYRERINQLEYRKSKQTNMIASWAITLPKKLVNTPQQSQYFDEMYRFFCERYGFENVISAFVHLDETTPHMHLKFIPVMLENGIEKVNAKKVVSRTELRRVHKDAEKHCIEVFGEPGLILNGATAGGNKTVTEMKLESLLGDIKQAENVLEDKKSQIERAKQAIKDYDQTRAALAKVNEDLQWNVGELERTKQTINELSKKNEVLKVEHKELKMRISNTRMYFDDLRYFADLFERGYNAFGNDFNKMTGEFRRIVDGVVNGYKDAYTAIKEVAEAAVGWFEYFTNRRERDDFEL